MTTTKRIAAIIFLALAGILGTATIAAAVTPGHTVTTTTTTTAKYTETCTTVKDTKANGDYRSEKTCRKSNGGSSHKVSVKVGATITSTSDTVSVSAKGTRTVTHTVTVTVNGKRQSQQQTRK